MKELKKVIKIYDYINTSDRKCEGYSCDSISWLGVEVKHLNPERDIYEMHFCADVSCEGGKYLKLLNKYGIESNQALHIKEYKKGGEIKKVFMIYDNKTGKSTFKALEGESNE